MVVEGAAHGVPPGTDVEVTPRLQTPAGLYLVNCRTADPRSDHFTSGSADICLLGPDAAPLDRAASGFM
jgi:hypothetical protein